jgi:hypothetical protein
MAADDAMFQVFHLDFTYVAMTIYVCCKYMFQVFRLFQMHVSNVLSGCCRSVSRCLHNMHVASVCFKCFRCFICMLQVFYLDVAKLDLDVACVYNGFQVFLGVLQVFQLFRTYVASVSSAYCKSRSGVTHVALGPPAAVACCSCRAVEKRTRHERSSPANAWKAY